MIAMRPIEQPAVLDEINAGRFSGPVEGYVVMDGPQYLGNFLYKVENGVTVVLDEQLADQSLVDGAVRAAVAAGENRGAVSFRINMDSPRLAYWKQVMFKNGPDILENKKLFHSCKDF